MPHHAKETDMEKDNNENGNLQQASSQKNPAPEPSGADNGKAAGSSSGPPNLLHTIFILILVNFLISMITGIFAPGNIHTDYSIFLKLVESDNVARVQIEAESLYYTLRADADLSEVDSILYPEGRGNSAAPGTDSRFSTTRIDDPALVERLNESDISFYAPRTRNSPILNFITSWIVPVIIMYFLYTFLVRRMMGRMGQGGAGSIFNVGKSKAKEYSLE